MPQKKSLIKTIIKKIQSNEKLYKSFNYSNPLQKYSITEYLTDILYVLKTGIAWRDIRSKIGWNSIYKVYCKLVKNGILKDCYTDLANKYFKNRSYHKLKILITDTSFVPNKNGKELIGKNRYYNKKYGTKISLITNEKGVPMNVTCYKGNRNDGKILENDLEELNKKEQIKNVIKSNNKKYFLADAGYDTKALNNTITKMNYKYIVAKNKRNKKGPIKKMNNCDKKIFKKRVTIEHMFKRIKNYRRLSFRYDCKIDIFEGFLYLAILSIFFDAT